MYPFISLFSIGPIKILARPPDFQQVGRYILSVNSLTIFKSLHILTEFRNKKQLMISYALRVCATLFQCSRKFTTISINCLSRIYVGTYNLYPNILFYMRDVPTWLRKSYLFTYFGLFFIIRSKPLKLFSDNVK